MAAYVLVDVEVTDAEQYDRYRPLASSSVEQYGGRYLARGGESEVLEGDRVPNRLVVLEFPDGEALAQRLRTHGLIAVRWHPFTFGIATLYAGTKCK